MTTRFYSSVASEKTLSGAITAGQTTLVVSNVIGLPTSFPYTLAVDFDTVSEELVNVTSAAGTTLTIDRAVDGTSATSHNSGARVRHVTSARDFADSRNHENADDGIHGLAPGEEIVGTDRVQTLTNKTVVDLQGTLLNPDVNLTGTTTTTFTRTPAGASTVEAINLVNGTEETLGIFNNGQIKVRNPLVLDTGTTERRLNFTMSDGTTERLYVEASGQVTSVPRSGTAAVNGGFKVLDPGDDVTRKLIQARNSTDTTDKFVVTSGGGVQITTSNNGTVGFRLKAPATPSTNWFEIVDNANTEVVTVETNGELNARRRMDIFNDTLPGNIVLDIMSHPTQTASIQTWSTSAGTALARVRADGSGDFTSVVTTTGIITPGAGWTTSSEIAVVKAGIATINLTLTRSGAALGPATANGNLLGDPPFGTIAAAFRPHSGFSTPKFVFVFSNDNDDSGGTGSLLPATGAMTFDTLSPNATIQVGSQAHVTLTYPLNFA